MNNNNNIDNIKTIPLNEFKEYIDKLNIKQCFFSTYNPQNCLSLADGNLEIHLKLDVSDLNIYINNIYNDLGFMKNGFIFNFKNVSKIGSDEDNKVIYIQTTTAEFVLTWSS